MKVSIVVRGAGSNSGLPSPESNLSDRIRTNDVGLDRTVPVMGSPFKLTVSAKPAPVIPIDRLDLESKSESRATEVKVSAQERGSKEDVGSLEELPLAGQDDDETINARVLEVRKLLSTIL